MSIGVTFIPSAQGQSATVPAPNAGNTDLSQAIKILSLRLPRILGGQAITPLAGSPGSNTDALSGTNPYAAVFSALLSSMNGGGLGGASPLTGTMPIDNTGLGSNGGSLVAPPTGGAPSPSFTFKQPRPDGSQDMNPAPTSGAPTPILGGGGRGGYGY